MRSVGLGGLATLLCCAAVAATQQVDVTSIGPQVGEQAIAFSLQDSEGRTQTLETLAGPEGTMLLFFRSADW